MGCYEQKVEDISKDEQEELDPVAFNLAMSEYFTDEAYIEIAGKLFHLNNIESWAEDQLALFEDEKNPEEVSA